MPTLYTTMSLQRLLLRFDQGPWYGLQLILNVQQYENLPFSEQDSGIKASVYILSFMRLQSMIINVILQFF